MREISTFSTIFKLNKVHQYNIFSTSHNRCTFLPLHDLSRKPIYKVCFKIQSTVDRHDFVSRSHNSFAFWCLPDIKSMLHEYWQRECLPVYLGNMHNYAIRIKGAGLSVVQYFDYTFKNLNDIRDTPLSKRLLVPKAEKNVNRIMTSWIWTNALPILSFLNENYFTASIQSSELFVFCTTRNDLRKRRHECVLALDS